MDISSIHHRFRSEMASYLGNGEFEFRLFAKKGEVEEAYFLYGDTAYPAKTVKMEKVKMEKEASSSFLDYFSLRLKTDIVRIVYAFELLGKGEKLYYYGEGFHENLSDERNDLFKYPYAFEQDAYRKSSWLSKAIFYNIFPDSFVREDVPASLKNGAVHGGSLKAVTESLDYIESLGCNAIYLNPIFLAEHYHRYDTEDYLSIDPALGTEDDFRELVKECHARNMHIIIDGVFNHSGARFAPFLDVLKNQEKSPYASWFYRMDFPIEYPCKGKPRYATFGYEGHMPKLDLDNEEARAYFLKVAEKWIGEFGADGFRMDTADECSPSFWRYYSKEIKKLNPEAVLIAETWQNPRPMVMDEGFDGAMDYDFRRAAISYLVNGEPSSSLADASVYLYYRLPSSKVGGMLSLLSTHDVPRFMSLLNEDDERMELAYVLQYTYFGAINLLYGDERGFDGESEDEYRRKMEWNGEGKFASLLRKLAKIRKEYAALTEGNFAPIYSEDGGLYGYRRSFLDQSLVIYLNRGNETRSLPEIASSKVIFSKGYEDNSLSPFGYLLFLE